MQKIKTSDKVIVQTGRSKGVVGVVLRVLDGGERLLVEGVNIVKKHVKPNPQQQKEGGILSQEAPIHVSNVTVYNSETGKADKVRFSEVKDESKPRKVRKVRTFASTGELIDVIEE